jgi:hypothetical protein
MALLLFNVFVNYHLVSIYQVKFEIAIPIWLAEESVIVAGTSAVTRPVAATAFTV